GGAAPLLARLEDARWHPSLVLDGLARWASA
ncbi:pantothenate kinase, partial [Lysobacter lacus]